MLDQFCYVDKAVNIGFRNGPGTLGVTTHCHAQRQCVFVDSKQMVQINQERNVMFVKTLKGSLISCFARYKF